MKKSRIFTVAAVSAMAAMSLTAVTAFADDYNAYIGVQSASYSFRNAWNDATYGKGVTGDDGTVFFDQITGWDGNTPLNKGGVFTDAVITGDGTYSVKVTDFDFGEDESMNLLFVSTDIPLTANATFSDVKVIIDGNTKYTFDEAYLSPDEPEYYNLMCINIWNSDIQDLFGYTMPTDSIEIQFTVSGLGDAGAAAEEAAPAEEAATEEATVEEAATEEPAPAADSETQSATTGNAAVSAIAAVMAVAGAAAFVSRRK